MTHIEDMEFLIRAAHRLKKRLRRRRRNQMVVFRADYEKRACDIAQLYLFSAESKFAPDQLIILIEFFYKFTYRLTLLIRAVEDQFSVRRKFSR